MEDKRPRFQRLLGWSQLFFFFSGATGLVYQVLWTRRLTLTFGHTVLAVSTVLTAFMAGLALGSLLSGWWTDRQSNERPVASYLRDYAYLEAFIGGWALLTLPLLTLVERLYVSVASSGISGIPLYAICFLAAAVVLIPPTTAMGATVPILARLLTHRPGQIGEILSRLYGLNTLGALVGAALSGFALLPALGLTAALIISSLVNFAIAGGALSKVKEFGSLEELKNEVVAPSEPPKKKKKKSTGAESDRESEAGSVSWLIPTTFAMAGAASMAYQVAWNRAICLAIGSSVYAFSTILVAFLGGIGLGSLLYPKIMGGRKPQLIQIAWLYSAIALTGGLTELALPLLPAGFLALFPMAGDSYLAIIVINLVLAGGLLMAPTLLMGLGFPLVTAVYSQSMNRLGRSVGEVYGANTLGCIFGSFVTGFVLMPSIGAQISLKVATLCYLLAAGLVVLAAASGKNRATALALLILTAGLCLLSPTWSTRTFAAGSAVYAGQKENDDQPAVYVDGLSSTVSFHLTGEYWEMPHMRVNGKVDASYGRGDRLTQYMLGYLPTLLHGSPERVGIIGLGGGFTVEAVAQCPGVKVIEVAELEPAVVKMGHYWKPYNSRVLEDPRVKLHINDGRTFVLATSEKFDVLISEPSNPWIAGIGNLFTRDFYETARARLNEDGIMCQWFNLYAVSNEDMLMVVRGFYDVFPHGQLWQSSGGDLILLGTNHPIQVDLARFRDAWRGSVLVQRHFFEAELQSPEGIAGHYLMESEAARDMAGEGPFNTDDKPLLEFSAPFSLYKKAASWNNQALLKKATQHQLPPGVEVSEDIRREALFASLSMQHYDHLQAELKRYGKTHPDAFVLNARLKRRLETGTQESIRNIYRDCLEAFPDDSSLAAIDWADLEYAAGNFPKAAELYLIALAKPPHGSEFHLLLALGKALAGMEDHQRAVAPLLRAARLDETKSTPLSLLGGVLVSLEQDKKALEVLQQAYQRNSLDPLVYQNRAHALFNIRQPRAAEAELVRFLEIIPEYSLAWTELGLCRKVLKDISGAREAYQRALELDPLDQRAARELQNL